MDIGSKFLEHNKNGGNHMNLKTIREENGLLQKDIASILNISKMAYCRYESEQRQPPIETLVRLANYYDISMDKLIGRDYKIQTN